MTLESLAEWISFAAVTLMRSKPGMFVGFMSFQAHCCR